MSLDMLLIHGKGETVNEDSLQRLESYLNRYQPSFAVYDEFTFNAKDVIQAKDRFSQLAKKYGCDIVLAANDNNERIVDNNYIDELRQKFEAQKEESDGDKFTFTFGEENGYLPGISTHSCTLPKNTDFEEMLSKRYHRKDDGNYYEPDGNRKWTETKKQLSLAEITHEDVSDEHIGRLKDRDSYRPAYMFQTNNISNQLSEDSVKNSSDDNIVFKKTSPEDVYVGSDYSKDDFEADSVGFYFGRDGSTYAFPKQWEDVPVHRIPDTNTGVSICGEVNNIKPEHLEGISLLLNPSRENDDPFMRARTSIYAGQSFEEATGYLGEMNERTKEMVREVSPYIGENHDYCRNNGVTVARTDSRSESSSLMCLPNGLKILQYEPNEDYSYISLDVER